MNYAVIWLPDAEQELAALWLTSLDRALVTKAAAVLDKMLERDPQNQGEFGQTVGRSCLPRPSP